MNNVHYMVKAVESSPALAVIGEDWIELHRDQACGVALLACACLASPSLQSPLCPAHCLGLAINATASLLVALPVVIAVELRAAALL